MIAGKLRRTAVAGAVLFAACAEEARPPSAVEPEETPLRFVADAGCAECHPAQAAAWADSHHDLAMQEATRETVLGDFDAAVFDHHGVTYRFRRRDGGFLVHTAGADGTPADFAVQYTFGVEPLQQYLVELDGGRLQALTIAWDTERRRWFALYDEPTPPGDLLHWTGSLLNWNAMCAECHSTDVRRGFDLDANAYATTWSAIDVGCQACHGPGSAHLAWARGVGEGGASAPEDRKGLAVTFADDAPRAEIEACARCHARRHPVSAAYRHGEPFLDHYLPALLDEDLYHADGQVLDEVYVYGSFVQSAMYRRGVRCTDCHEPHAGRLVAEGDAVCTPCHRAEPPDRFPTLAAKVYDAAEHHHHETGAAGSACVDCHMPARTYMVVDPRRDHSLRVPRPDLTARLGTPNACGDCHPDRPAEWAAEAVRGWFPDGRAGAPHFAEALAAGRAGAPEAEGRLIALATDTAQPAIARATALSLLRRQPGPAALAVQSASLDDGDALVRASAATSLAAFASRTMPRGFQRQLSRPLVPRLRDPRRAVRIEAARALSGLEPDVLDAAARAALDAALGEFFAAHAAHAHDPAAHLNRAVVQANLGRREEAEASYRTALRLQPAFLPARFNLATLYNEDGRNAEAERELRAVLAVAPAHGDGHYSLGLLLAEVGRLEEAERHLARAAAALPSRPRVAYNHALALQRLGRLREAESALERAAAAHPGDPEIARALAALRERSDR